jgi:SAM-dependent methyltransferase
LTLRGWLRYEHIRRLLGGELGDVRSILEVGAGSGALAARLAGRYDYTGLDLDDDSCVIARQRLGAVGRGRVLHGDLDSLDPEERFDVVCAFEVLEHIPDDVAALQAWTDRLCTPGWVLLSVPAGPHRFAAWDRKVGHCRRYSRAAMEDVLGRAGLVEPVIVAYGFPLDYALETARNTIASRSAGHGSAQDRTRVSGRLLQPPSWAGWATRAASAPFRLAQRPFAQSEAGTGLVVRARRPG